MAEILAGKPVVQKMRIQLQERIALLKERAVTPTLRIIRIGERPDDIAYERSLLKQCEKLKMACQVVALPATVTQEMVHQTLIAANQAEEVHGILLFRPLPDQLDIEPIKKLIDPIKDVDCMNPTNLGNLLHDRNANIVPCTAQAVITLLEQYQVPLQGADVVVVGASFVVGRPLAILLIDRMATVTICNVHTKDLAYYTRHADVVVSAAGVAKLLHKEHFSERAIVVDVGINLDENGLICGDVDFETVVDHVKAITPAIGGVGTITTTVLLSHVVTACEVLLDIV